MDALRKAKLEGKIFHVKKCLAKAVKKAQTLELRKIVKRLKDKSGDDKLALEGKLEELKTLDHKASAEVFFADKIVNDYISSKMQQLGIAIAKDATLQSDVLASLAKNGPFLKDIKSISDDLQKSMQKIFHEGQFDDSIREAEEAKRKEAKERKEAKKQEKLIRKPLQKSIDKSLFVSSLNAENDDHSDSDDSDSERSSTNKNNKKKNRPGQQERRRLWEAKYGKDAKHVKEGKSIVDRKPRKPREKVIEPINMIKHVLTSVQKSKPEQNNNNMHPSWIAKQKEKEKMSITEFKGTKVTFDD